VDQHADPSLIVSLSEGVEVLYARDRLYYRDGAFEHLSRDEIAAAIESTPGDQSHGDDGSSQADTGSGPQQADTT
jgi:hypothetical protein